MNDEPSTNGIEQTDEKPTSASLSKSKNRFLEPLLPTSLDGCDSTGIPCIFM